MSFWLQPAHAARESNDHQPPFYRTRRPFDDAPTLSAGVGSHQCICRERLGKVIFNAVNYGYGAPIIGPINPKLSKWYVADLKTYPIDLKAAEALLDEAGYKRGADYIRQALAKVGIEVTVRAQDFPAYTKHVYTDRDFDFAYEGMSNLFDPKKRVAQWTEIQRILVDDVPAIDIAAAPEITIDNKRIVGHTVGAEGVAGSLAFASIVSS